jgi:membrane protein implicated in regulation of membrane protease activity
LLNPTKERTQMLWLVLGTILLILGIAGGAIVNPILFVLALVALFMFFSGWRGSGRTI